LLSALKLESSLQVGQLRRQRDDATGKLTALQQENERLRHDTAELAKLRGEVARLRRDANDVNKSKASPSESDGDSTRKNILAFASAQENLIKIRNK
jgi:type II secretory pathway component PulM